MAGRPDNTQRREARRRAKEQRDKLLQELTEAEGRGDSQRINVIRDAVAKADRNARGAA